MRDQVAVEARLADHLGIDRFAAVIGGSMGGMRALEWAIDPPERVGSAVVLATGAAATGDQIGTQSAQILAITSDPAWQGGDYSPFSPPASAWRAGSLTSPTAANRSSTPASDARRSRAKIHCATAGSPSSPISTTTPTKLVGRFDAGSYVALTDAMNTHDVGRGRGGVAAALASITAPVVVGGIDTDRLYPLRLQAEIAELTPTCVGLDVIESPYGHDGFLIEVGAVSKLVGQALDARERSVSRPVARP